MAGRTTRRDDAPVFVMRRTRAAHRPGGAAATHTYAAIAVCTSGRARVEQRGTWILEAGDVLLVPPGEPHRIVDSTDAEICGLGFCVPCFVDAENAALIEPFERVRAGGSAVCRLEPGRLELVERLLRELEGDAPLAVQRSVLTLVLNEVTRNQSATAPAGSSVVSDALQYIQQHCLGPLTLATVARAVRRSPAHVTTAIRKATGRSAVAWITAGRMAAARRFLLHSDEYVDVIAGRVGYADPTHFIRMFRREHGETPAAWRRARASARG
jgi:AraC family transcriptional regulator, transcriptional activator of pobA